MGYGNIKFTFNASTNVNIRLFNLFFDIERGTCDWPESFDETRLSALEMGFAT